MEEVDREKKKPTWPPSLQEVQTFTPWPFFMWRNACVKKKKKERKKERGWYADTARVTYVIHEGQTLRGSSDSNSEQASSCLWRNRIPLGSLQSYKRCSHWDSLITPDKKIKINLDFLYRQKINSVFYNIFHKSKCLKCMELLPFISHVSKIYVLQISLSPNIDWTYTKICGTAINMTSPAVTVPIQEHFYLTVVSIVTKLLSGNLNHFSSLPRTDNKASPTRIYSLWSSASLLPNRYQDLCPRGAKWPMN